jgi:hypothetical protein
MCPQSSTLTLQALLSIVFPEHIPSDFTKVYHRGCASLLEALGAKYHDVLNRPSFSISRALLMMGRVLLTTKQVRMLSLVPAYIALNA